MCGVCERIQMTKDGRNPFFVKELETGDSTTFFCSIRNIQMDERLVCRDVFDVDLTVLDPVIYSGKYHSIGKLLGNIGDFLKE